VRIGDMFPRRYANGDDLQGKATALTIERVQQEEMRPGGAAPVKKWVIYFKGAQRGVILSRVLAGQIAEALGDDDTDHWPGKKVVLYPVPMTVAGRPVTAIRARAAAVKE
jgi:hypothetical protein